MSAQELSTAALALPLPERVSLAQDPWQSIDESLPAGDERQDIRNAIRRDRELSDGTAAGRTREGVMAAARRAIECA